MILIIFMVCLGLRGLFHNTAPFLYILCTIFIQSKIDCHCILKTNGKAVNLNITNQNFVKETNKIILINKLETN